MTSKVYTVYATEQVYYAITTVAESAQDAIQKVTSGVWSSWDTIDGNNFQIDQVFEGEDLVTATTETTSP